jgi:UDP-4-amino-4,6-dideoxy-N-acetyl-beta-L-altrosamine transaminase
VRPIPYGRQSISEEDVRAVVEVLRSDFLTQGPAVPAFEQAIAAYCGGGVQAVAVNSATSALHLACLAVGVGPGDLVWTVPTTFVASANCARYCGADVDFVDIDPRTWNLSVAALAAKLERAKAAGRLPKAVIPVHLSGQPCELAPIADLAKRYGFKVIEDASHAVGARYRGEPVGSCRHSDVTVFSFHPVKIVTTGEGGVATARDPALARRMALLRSHGITREAAELTRPSEGPWYYEQVDLGFNYRITDLQAALGKSQLSRLDAWVARRNALAERYDRALAGLALTTPFQHPDVLSSRHLYVIRLDDASRRRAVFEALRAAQIGVNLHYIPVHRQPYYERLGFRAGQFPEAERYGADAISLPLFPDLSEADQDYVVEHVRRLVRPAPSPRPSPPAGERGSNGWRLALGTAQLGLDYGVANRTGQVSERGAREMIDLARRRGVRTLDTAALYGTSEAVLGNVGVPDLDVVTKLPGLPPGADPARFVRETLAGSLSRLRVPRVAALLLHRPADLLGPQGPALWKALEAARAEGRAAKIGFSIYAPAELEALLPRHRPNLVQAPLNVVDRRLVTSGWLARLAAADVEVHVRSAFLQGLLLLAPADLPPAFARWRPLWQEWAAWLAEARLTPIAACLRWVLSHREVERVVVGADGVRQLEEILAAAESAPVAVPARIARDDEDLVNPSRWPRT